MNPIKDSKEIKLNPFNVLNKQDEGIVDQILIYLTKFIQKTLSARMSCKRILRDTFVI